MEIHEEFRINISNKIRDWCYYPPLDVVIYESNQEITVIEAATGCINRTFDLKLGKPDKNIFLEVLGKEKLVLAQGNVFNCRSKFHDTVLLESALQTPNYNPSTMVVIDVPMPESQILIDLLKSIESKWIKRDSLGFSCSLDLDNNSESFDNVWKWNIVTFTCPINVLYDWILEIIMEFKENFSGLPLISSIIYRIKSLQMMDHDIRFSIYERSKEFMNIEANRFLSFEMWPHKTYKWATPELMSRVGFYHHPRKINDDRALCFLCNICLITWEATDEPWSEHQRHSPNCPLFKNSFTTNVPLSISEATMTAQKQSAHTNIVLIAKSAGNRYAATIAENGHICIWDTSYLLRKLVEFDTPDLSKDGIISIDSACLIENSLLIKNTNKINSDKQPGFHLVLGVRLNLKYNSLITCLQTIQTNTISSASLGYLLAQETINQQSSFIFIIEIPYEFSLVTSEERKQFPDFGSENIDFQSAVDFEFFEECNQSFCQTSHFLQNKSWYLPSYDEFMNDQLKDTFLANINLGELWNESKDLTISNADIGDKLLGEKFKNVISKPRNIADTNLIEIIPIILDDLKVDIFSKPVTISDIHPVIVDTIEENETISSVYLMANCHREKVDESVLINGALLFYKCLFNMDAELNITMKLQNVSTTYLMYQDCVRVLNSINIDLLESNCSESSSTTNAEEQLSETLPNIKSISNKSQIHWLLLTNNNEIFLYATPLSEILCEKTILPLADIATRIPLNKDLSGNITGLQLFSDMDRLCLLTDDGVMAFYTITTKRRSDSNNKPVSEPTELDSQNIDVPDSKVVNHVPELNDHSITPEPLLVEQDSVIDRLNHIYDLIQYEIVTSRIKLTYGCNWVEVSQSEIIDLKTNGSNFITTGPITLRYLPTKPGSTTVKVSDQQQCYSRTLNFRASQVCSREQIIEFSTAKQLCLGHIDLRFDLYEKQNKNSNLIYVTLLRQHKYVGINSAKEPNCKLKSSVESNIIINDLEAPFIDDDMAQYYDTSNSQEPNSDVLRKLDGEIIAGPYLLNKYYQSGTTSIFLSMTSAELIKCRSRHYAIHIRVRSPIVNVENRSQSSSSNVESSPIDLNNYGKCDSTALNIKSVTLSLRKFSNSPTPIHNDRSQRLAILRNPKFLRKLLKLISGELISKMCKSLVTNYSFDILNWIIVMYLNDIKPHSEKVYKLISTVNEYLKQIIYKYFIHGDREISKKVTKILTTLINLEKRYWSFDSRFVNVPQFDCYKLCKSIYSILNSNMSWLLLAKSSVSVQNYFILMDTLEQLFIPSNIILESDSDDLRISMVEKLSFLENISEKYSHLMDKDGSTLLKSILGYSHNPLTGELFDIHITNLEMNKITNNLHTNLSKVINRKSQHSSDFGVNDLQTKNLLNSLSDQVYKQVLDHANQSPEPCDDIVSNNFSLHDLQKAFREMVMDNVKNNIQLMRIPTVHPKSLTPIKTPEPIDSMSSNLSAINCSPWFKSLLWSKMNSKSSIYSDMKKKSKITTVNYINQQSDNNGDSKPYASLPDQIIPQHRINMLRNNSILEVDFLPVYFESASEGTVLDAVENMQFDQLVMNEVHKFDNYHQLSVNPLNFIDERNSQPTTPKTTPVITTHTTPMHVSPISSPLPSTSPNKSVMIEDPNSMLTNNSNDQRLNYSLQTNCTLNVSRMSYIVVNRLHANARRNIILNLRQWCVITDIVIPSCDKLQKIIVRVGPTNKEEEMQTIVIHSNIIAEPLLLLNIQPEIVCHYVQIVIIAKSNITAERSRINIGTLYGRPALMSWEIPSGSLTWKADKAPIDSINHMLEYLLPRTETISMHYAIASETLRQLLFKLSKTGINQQILSDTLPDYPYHHGKIGYKTSKQIDILKLLNQINSVYHKCCQLQQQISIVNNHINRYRSLLTNEIDNRPMDSNDKHFLFDDCNGDKLKVLIEIVLESLLLDKNACVGTDNLSSVMDSVSNIMTNLMIYGTREMQTLLVSWIPKMITSYNDSGEMLKIWFHKWLKDFLLRCFSNKSISISPFIKEEIFSYLCVIFQRLANAGYHQHLFENMLDIFIIILQPSSANNNVNVVSVDLELFNWILLFIDFLLLWIKDDEYKSEENSFSEWKFLFWNPYINCDTNEKLNSKSIPNSKEKFTHLKQQLLLLTKHKENFIDYLNETGYDSWFCQLILTEYSSMYEKLIAKITATITKLKKTVSSTKIEKPMKLVTEEESKFIPDSNIKSLSSLISTIVKLLMNTLKYMDFQVSQDTFILTCMVLNKLFMLAQVNGCHLNSSMDKQPLSAIVERAFIEPLHCRMNVSFGVFSLHACRILLLELVRNDLKILVSNKSNDATDKINLTNNIIPPINDVDDQIIDCVIDNDNTIINEDDDDLENEEEDITPTGADDEDVNSLIEPYAVYVTHLGNLSKQKDMTKYNEDSPSDEYTDLVEEFDLLGHPTSFISSYAKGKMPKDYQTSIKTIEMEKSANITIDLSRTDITELASFNSIMFYDLRLENSIFTDQEISYNHNQLRWRHQVQTDIYEQLPIVPSVIRPMSNHINQKLTKPVAISHIFEAISELLDDKTMEKFNIQEIASFVCHICHLLEKENLLTEFDSLQLSSTSLLSLLERLAYLCSTSGSLLLNYCQLICTLLSLQSSFTGEIKFYKTIFQLADELDNRDVIEEVLDLFQLIVTKSLDTADKDFKFVDIFLDVVYDIIDNWHLSKDRSKSKSREQLAWIYIVCIKSKLIGWLQSNPSLLFKYVYKVTEITSRFLKTSSTDEQRKCFSSLVPEVYTIQLLQIEQSALPGSIEELMMQKQVFVQLNLVILEIISANQQLFLPVINFDLLTSLFVSLSQCNSSMLEASKCFDVSVLSTQLVKHSQSTTVADIVWQQLVSITKLLLNSTNKKAKLILSALTETIQLSIPAITEPLFLMSIWLIPQFPIEFNDEGAYTDLLTNLISCIITFSNSRLSISPVNTFATRLAVSIMQQTAKPNSSFPNLKTDEISNNSRPNVSPFCQISCQGNDSSDPQLLAKLLSNQLGKPFNTLRSTRSKALENVWSYEFYPHETQVQITISLPCDMIVHKIILIPRSIREFSPRFEVIIKRDSANHSTTIYQQIHKSLILNDGIIIDHINSRKLSNKIIIRFDKPLLSKLVLQKIEICTINQWWDHRFQLAGDVANLFIYRCLHLFNHILKNQSTLKQESIYLTLLENKTFFSILLNWNHMYSIANSPTNKLLIKNSSNLITDLLVYLGKDQQEFSIIILNQILENVSLISVDNSLNAISQTLQFSNEVSMMKLSIFYNILTISDQYSDARLNVVIQWFDKIEFKEIVTLDSAASIVYLLSVVIWHQSHNSFNNKTDWLNLFSAPFIHKLRSTILNSSSLFKRSAYRLLTSICSLHQDLYKELINISPIISHNNQHLNRDNLKLVLWASQSEIGSKLLLHSGILTQLIDRINRHLMSSEVSSNPQLIYMEISEILKFFTKLCLAGCNFIKVFLGSDPSNSFWQPIIDYLIDYNQDANLISRTCSEFSSVMKVQLNTAVVKYFSAVTSCCEENQITFIKILINTMDKYRLRSDTLVLSDCIRRLILEVVVKEPEYCVAIDSDSATNNSINLFPGWIMYEDEFGNSRLSFRHPSIASQSNCIFIDNVSMTNKFSSIISQLTDQLSFINRKSSNTISTSPRTSNSYSEVIDYFLNKFSDPQNMDFKLRSNVTVTSNNNCSNNNNNSNNNHNQSLGKLSSKFGSSSNISISLYHNGILINNDDNLFDFVTKNQLNSEFDGGFLKLSSHISKVKMGCCPFDLTPGNSDESHNYLLVRFTEMGGLKLLGKMLPLLFTDIRRVSSTTVVCRTPVNNLSSHTGFIDDDLTTPTDLTKSHKSLPQIPAHSITAFCLFLNIDQFPNYVINEKEHRSALLHLLLGVTYDNDGVSLLQKYPKLQCVPFILLSRLLQNQSISSDAHQVIINTCVELGLIDYFINLLSILGHVDSGQSVKCLKSSGPWWKFISQTLFDLHYQLFYPLNNTEKPDAKSNGTPKSAHIVTTTMDPKSHYITFMPFIDEKKNYWAKGTGFGTGGMYSTWDSEFVLMRQNLEELNASAILDTLSAFIYPTDEEKDVDYFNTYGNDILPARAVECIYQSILLVFICSYLRNDSVLDVSQHVNIYKSILRLIRAMAKQKCFYHFLIPHISQSKNYLDPQLYQNISNLASTNNICQLLSQLKICVDTYINRLKKVPGATNKTPENTRRLQRQLSIRRKNSNYIPFHQNYKIPKHTETDNKEEQNGAESENLAQLLPDINSTVKLLNDIKTLVEKRNKYETSLSNSSIPSLINGYVFDKGDFETNDEIKISKENHYIELMRKLQFGMYEIIHPNPDQNGKIKFTIPYHFKKNVESIFSTNSASASLSRARRLAQETVTLSTSLPLSYSSSVFVRCDENHLDIMKVIIVGPPDTPYANGCFEFDVYFPMEYPKAPPLLNLQTTGNGSVRFNPNLYNEGKVCLSILNTWHGRPEERWSSRTSSFLQVLVSIQSLILVPEPYFNEPGYERSRGTPSGNNASLAYSANIQAATARWAILEMIKNPPVCFAEVIKQHFLLKKDEIINQIQSWIDFYLDSTFDTSLYNSTRPSISNSVQSLKKNIILIKKELENLEKENLQL